MAAGNLIPVRTVIFFDLVNTLIRPRSSIGTQYAAIARGFGIDADPRALDRVFRRVLDGSTTFALPDSAGADLPRREKRAWRAIVEDIFRAATGAEAPRSTAFDDYFEALFNHFTTRDAWDLYRDVVPSLAGLKRAGHHVGLISNFDSRIFPLLDHLGLTLLFDSVTIPALAGAAKPDPAIFHHALAVHGAVAAEAVYVGDSMAEDVLPARSLGMEAILIDRGGRCPAVPGVPRIRSLARLSRLL